MIIFILLLSFLSCSNSNKNEKQKNTHKNNIYYNTEIKEQVSYKREWKKFTFIHLYDLNRDSIFNPIHIKVDNKNNMFVYDFSIKKIKKYSSDFSVVGYGNGQGSGPKEFINITDYCITDNNIYICDPPLSKISVFLLDGYFVKSNKLDIPPYRIAVLGDNKTVVKPTNFSKNLFDLYDKSYIKIGSFGKPFLLKAVERAILMDGSLCSDKNSTIFYAFRYMGLIYSYNIKNKIGFYIKTVDKTKKPKLEIIADGKGVKAPRNKPIPCLDISYSNDNLYILSYSGEGIKEKQPVMDVYSAKDCSYQYSFHIPVSSASVVINDNLLYAIYTDTKGKKIGVWKF